MLAALGNLRGDPMQSFQIPVLAERTAVAALLVSLAGCTTSMVDPQGVGNGQYLQIVKDTQVLAEIDTSNVGLMNCPNQAYMLTQQTPALAGRVKCAHASTTQQLAFGFTTHIQTNESDGYKRSSPYRTRTSTTKMCSALLSASKSQEKAVIVEEHCGG
jgi:hypothetical protein